jgi:hypothetical protein
MSVNPIQSSNRTSTGSSQGAIKTRTPQGLAQTPDRIEKSSSQDSNNPPSLFKMFLFEPIIQIVKFLLRGLFTFLDFLRSSAFEEKKPEKALTRDLFLDRLQTAPPKEKLLIQFTQVYSIPEQNQVYQAIGEAHKGKVSWKETFWERTPEQNIALGRRLVKENPFLLRDHLFS